MKDTAQAIEPLTDEELELLKIMCALNDIAHRMRRFAEQPTVAVEIQQALGAGAKKCDEIASRLLLAEKDAEIKEPYRDLIAKLAER